MKDDASLLREFVEDRAETAFAELLRRHIDLVYSVALRQVAGDTQLAQDATQAVFCELAAKAPHLLRHRALAGWLYNTARFVSARMQRGETRRKTRELAFAMNEPQSPSATCWQEVESVLDDAMQELPEKDREAVILRYFQNKPLAEVGAAVGLHENAARMRVDRALDKLRSVLTRRGIKSSSAVLGAALATHAVTIAPAGLASVIIGPAIAATTTAATIGGGFTLLKLMASTKLKTGIATLALAGATTAYVVTDQKAAALRTEVAQLQNHAAEADRLRTENARLAKLEVDAQELARLRAQHSELMRLRGEVAMLRKEKAEAAALAARQQNRPAAPQAAPVPAEIAEEQRKEALKTLGIAKMRIAKEWGLAVHLYANENNGKMPKSFEDAAKHLRPIPEDLEWVNSLSGASEFEIVFSGSLHEIENPAQAILLREKAPFNIEPTGAASRTYLFADGHSEIHRSADGSFERWEQQRVPRLRGAQQNNLGGR